MVFFFILFRVVLGQTTQIHSYQYSDEIFSNPERGFWAYRSHSITGSFIQSCKTENISVIYRIYYIPEFRNQALSDEFLNLVNSDLNVSREGGMKLVLRFAYTDYIGGEDAPLDIILGHINQLSPIFYEHFDVIAFVQAGFIGAWGEWHSSTNGLDNTEDRRTILFALLQAIPTERTVAIRTPGYKKAIFNDENPLSVYEAFSGTNKSRTGAHNDCFLADATDMGTYDYNDIEGDKNYLNQDNNYVPQSGETCQQSEFSVCDNALIDLNRMHWSLINKDYNTAVIQDWEANGCLNEIKRKLGYRFYLLEGEFSSAVKPNGIVYLRLKFVNEGFASPFNKHNLEFVLRNTLNQTEYRAVTNSDTRFWFSGDTITTEFSIGIPQQIEEGNYNLFLHLADPVERLHYVPSYSIRLANQNVWESETGFNNLNHVIIVNDSVSGEDYSGNNFFELEDSLHINPSQIIIDGYFNDWSAETQIDILENAEEIGDALNNNVDIVDCWVTESESNVYFSFSVAGNFDYSNFYHVYIDADKNITTGFHLRNSYIGCDLMVENEKIYKFTGSYDWEWSWEEIGSVFASRNSENNRIEMSLFKETFELFGPTNSINFIFNINDINNSALNDFSPNNYTNSSYSFTFQSTNVNLNPENIPTKYEIHSFPNPFNGITNITFNIPKEQIKEASIYDVLGRKITSFTYKEIENGKIIWNTSLQTQNIGSGVFFFAITTKNSIYTTKLIYLK